MSAYLVRVSVDNQEPTEFRLEATGDLDLLEKASKLGPSVRVLAFASHAVLSKPEHVWSNWWRVVYNPMDTEHERWHWGTMKNKRLASFRPLVHVYPPYKVHDKTYAAQVNWSATGAVEPEEAEVFSECVRQAAVQAAKLNSI